MGLCSALRYAKRQENASEDLLPLGRAGIKNMLGMFAAVLNVLCLFGFFAFHIASGFFCIVLLLGLIWFAVHFIRDRAASA